MKSMS